MKYCFKFILVLFACWFVTGMAFSQETLEDKRKRADEFFKAQNWAEAEPLYGSIISNAPRDPDLNFRYGTCLLFGSKNKEEAIKRLRFAVTSPTIDKRAYYYLGRAYHLNYQFNEAIKQYTRFKEVATPSDIKGLGVETDIKACNYGKKLLANVTDMIVLEKTELNAERFYDLYKLDDIGGRLLVTDEFQTKYDKKMGHRPIIHFPSNSPYIYYSSYGENGETGLDIYVKKKLPSGEWSEAQRVKGSVNTDENENYAYMHPGGQYLYFCSEGHNSMGGYDVFRSKYHAGTDTFDPPENLDFAISSPDDDLLFVVDSLDRNAYFSSSRESGQGNLMVYKVRVDRIPMQMAVIKGSYFNAINNNEKEIEIIVTDFSSGEQIGIFNSRKTNGDYLMTFPKSGKYDLLLTAKGSDITHQVTLDIPYSKEFKPLKQTITLQQGADGEEEIVITNKFNEDFADPVSVLAEVYRELSKLPPNAQDFDLDSLDALKATDDILVDAGLDPYITKEGMEAVLVDEIEDITPVIEEEKDQANIAFNLALEKSNEANEKMLELNNLLKQADGTTDKAEKTRILEEVVDKKAEVEALNNEAQSLIDLGEKIEKSVAEKEATLQKANEILTEVKTLDEKDRDALIGLVQENNAFFQENVRDNAEQENIVAESIKKGEDEQERVQEISEEISDFSRQKRELLAEKRRLEKRLEAEKKKKVQEEIQREIDDVDSQIATLDRAIASKTTDLDAAINESTSVRDGIAAALILKDENNTPEYKKELSAKAKQGIAQQVKINNLDESLAAVDGVLEENEVSSFNIDLYASDEQTSGYSLQDWNEAIDEEAERLREEKLKASEERQKQIQEELDRLERLREEKIAEYEVISDEPREIKPDVSTDEVLPNYTSRKESIGEIVNEGDRRKATVDLNYELINEIEKEREQLEQVLADDPKNKNAKERLANLNAQETVIREEIAADEEWMRVNGETTNLSPDEVVVSLDPEYQNKINKAWEIVDEAERNKAIRGINEVIIEKSNERIQELEAIVAGDPENSNAQEELVYLQDFVKDIEANKEQTIVEPELTNPDELSTKVEPGDLVQDYDRRKKVIDGISDNYVRRTKENELFNEVVEAAAGEIKRMDRLAQNNPGNKNIEKRQDAVRALEEDFKGNIAKNNDWLQKNQSEAFEYADATTVLNVNPEYQARINQIDEIPNKSEKKEAIQQLNITTLERIETRLTELDERLSANPDDASAAAEKEQLEALKEQITEKADKPLIPAEDFENLSVNPTADEIYSGYSRQLNEINIGAGTEQQKNRDKIALNEELIKRIDREINKLNELKAVYPDLAGRFTERQDNLKELKSATESDNEAFSANIGETDVAANRPDITANGLMPSYSTNLGAINASDRPEQEKLEEINKLHRSLISAIDRKITDLETEKANNPALAATIDGEIAQLNALKVEKEGEITANESQLNTLAENNGVVDGTDRDPITITALMPDYETDLAAIRSSNDPEQAKLEAENDLNGLLIGAVDWKIGNLETEKEENPNLTETIDGEIAQLNEIRSTKNQEIEANNERIASLADNTGNDGTNDTTVNENTAVRPTITIGTLMADYESQIAAIRNGNGTKEEKLRQENQAHEALIEQANARIAELEQEQNESQNDAEKALIQNDITTVNSIKETAQNAIQTNEQELEALTVTAERPEITIDGLVTDFDSKMSEIDDTDMAEEEKLKEKNLLNNELVDAIDAKILEIEAELNNDPENRDVYNEELDKLEELRESKLDEIANNQAEIADLTTNEVEVAELKTTDFTSTAGQETVAEFENELNEINELDNDIETLNDQLSVASSEKEKKKLEKGIAKAEVTKAKLENEVIEGLEEVNREEVTASRNDLDMDRDLTAESTSSGNDVKDADQLLALANQKMRQAASLRNEAEDIKDPLAANAKLKEAFTLENEAKELTEEAGRIYKTARVIDEYATEDPVVTDVPENVADRESTALLDEAAAIRSEANANYRRAEELRDSSETVKKKFKQAIIEEAEALEVKAGILEEKADNIEEKAELVKAQEEEFLMARIDPVVHNVDIETAKEVSSTDAYKNYFEEKNEGDEKLEKAEEIGQQIEELQKKRTRKFKRAVVINEENPESEIDNDPEIAADQALIDSLTNEQKRLRDEALANYSAAKDILDGAPEADRENLMALAQNGVEPTEAVNDTATGFADFVAPDNIQNSIFRTTQSAVYSDDAPIPVGEKQPGGLVYKVQVGAFRNPLPQDHFSQFAPISGEKLNNGITRYMVGYFKKFDPANGAKTQVNGLGYTDAFVVAYCNGERITVDRARLIEEGLLTCDPVAQVDLATDTNTGNDGQNVTNNDQNDTATNNSDNQNNTDSQNNTDNQNTNAGNDQANNQGNDNTADNTNDTNAGNANPDIDLQDRSETMDFEPTTTEERRLTDYYTSVPGAAEANQVEIIDELFYTVQIGVYSKPVPASALNNISPLNSQRTESGFIRYSTGIFTSEEAATIRKDEVVALGIQDAFVTAYYEGERITMDEAYQVLVREGADALVGHNEEEDTGTNTSDGNEMNGQFNKEGLHYRLLIGKYENAIPGEYATILLQGGDVFDTEVDAEGRTCLLSNKLTSLEEVKERAVEFADLGIESMDVVTYYKYDVIPFEEGEKIRNDEEITELHPYEEIQGISADDYIYSKDAIYFKIKLGVFNDKVPTDFTNLLLLHGEEESINKEETIDDQIIFCTRSMLTFEEAEAARQRLRDYGFNDAEIIAFHKYDEISIGKAREILEEQ